MKNSRQEELIRRYLLGDLTEAEMTALEDRYLADQETFEQIWAIENELVDGYARGWLSRAERVSFERHYLASPEHRQRVAFAKMLVEAADAGVEPRESWLSRFVAFLRAPQMLPAGALALALIVTGFWLLNERAQLRRQIAQLSGETAVERRRAEEQSRQLAAERQRNDQLNAQIEKLRAEQRPAEPPTRPSIFAFLLSSSLVRGAGDPQRLNIPASASHVSLRMKLEENDYTAYRITIKTVAGREVFTQSSVRARAGKDGVMVAVAIPASRLAADDYILTLFGLNERGEAEEVNRYFFRVSAR